METSNVAVDAAKGVEDAVAPLVHAGDKLSDVAQNALGFQMWHFILTLAFLLLVLYWLRSLHKPIGEWLCSRVQTRPHLHAANLQTKIICYGIIVIGSLPIAYGIGMMTKNLTEEIFNIDFVMVIMLLTQAGFWLVDVVLRRKGTKRSRFNRYIIAHLIKYVLVFLASLGVLLIFDIHISELMQWQDMSWLIPAFYVVVFAPFVLNGGLSAVKFAFTHPIRIGDLIEVDGNIGVFTSATPYAITLKLLDGANLTLPLNKISGGYVRNLQTRHSLEVSRTILLSPDTRLPAIERCITKIRAHFEKNKKQYSLRTCSIGDVRGFFELTIVYNIGLKKSGRVSNEISAMREDMNLKIIELLQAEGVTLWRGPTQAVVK